MDFASVLCDLIAIPSLSGDEAQIADYIESFLRRRRVDVERDDQDNLTAVVGDGDRILHVNGHMDTVKPAPGWTRDPFTPQREGGRIYGLGATDMKCGLAVMMHLACVVKPRVQTVFSFVVCEDGSAPPKQNGTATLLKKWSGDWAITVESSVREGKLTLGLGTQGHALAEVVVRGKAAHSSRPEDGRNAISDAARLVERIDRLNASWSEIPILGDAVSRPTIAATLIAGGVAANIIPDECRLTISRRLAVGETRETFEKELKELTRGLDAEVRPRGGDPAVCTDLDGPLFAAARDAFQRRFGEPRYSFARGRTDLVLFGAKGMDVLNCGPGSGEAHAADEYCDVEDMPAAAALLQDIIEGL